MGLNYVNGNNWNLKQSSTFHLTDHLKKKERLLQRKKSVCTVQCVCAITKTFIQFTAFICNDISAEKKTTTYKQQHWSAVIELRIRRTNFHFRYYN